MFDERYDRIHWKGRIALNHTNKINYQLLCEREIEANEGKTPRLLLHSCCAPCSSYVLEYLTNYFDITVLYYNPNITPAAEYDKRVAELKRLIAEAPYPHPVRLMEGRYDSSEFFAIAKGLEDLPEGGERCFRCYTLRLEESARMAAEGHYDYFTTTLSVSPYKNADKLNAIGRKLSEQYGVSYLYSDFKKKNGYKRSIELSAQYGLYRQDYCGCVYSKIAAEKKRVEKRGTEE
ncbi:MAG: epoxyqueuosine reductase QueH [Clostridia bacterium]|nr:epoxyqueuosine reductase QueH [Clostridia bacterium]